MCFSQFALVVEQPKHYTSVKKAYCSRYHLSHPVYKMLHRKYPDLNPEDFETPGSKMTKEKWADVKPMEVLTERGEGMREAWSSLPPLCKAIETHT